MTTRMIFCTLIYIILVRNADGGIPVHTVQSAKLLPMPYRIEDTYLLGLTRDRRREICNQIRAEMEIFVFPAEYNQHYIAEAHMYEFDTEKWLALQCPTFPPIYVSHEWIKTITPNVNDHQWYVRMVKPRVIADCSFDFEMLSSSYPYYNAKNPKQRPTGHTLYEMSQITRWYLCEEARSRLRYEIDVKKEYIGEEAQFYEYEYENKKKEAVFAIKCYNKPAIYLSTVHAHMDLGLLITVSLTNGDEKYEIGPQENIV